MKILRIIAVCLIFAINARAQSNFTFQPERPKAGQTIQIRYNPTGTELTGAENIGAIAYILANKNMPVGVDIPLSKKGNEYTGSIPVSDSTSAVFVRFISGDQLDNNAGKGYYTLIYGNDDKPVQGAALALGLAFGNHSYPVGITPDSEKLENYLHQEFRWYPGSKQKYRYEYVYSLGRFDRTIDRDPLKEQLELITADANATEEELDQAKTQYEHVFKSKVKSAAVDSLIKQRFPKGDWLKRQKLDAFHKETNIAKKDSLYLALTKEFPPLTPEQDQANNFMAAKLVELYGLDGNYEKMKEASTLVKDNSILASAYNSVAWDLAGKGINGKPRNLKMGKELSAKSLELVKLEMANDQDKRPVYLTAQQWKERQQTTYYIYADTYATLLYHSKEYEKAYTLEKEAVEFFKRSKLKTNETYCVLTEKLKGTKAAQQELELFVKEGKASGNMRDQLKRIYIAQNHTQPQWMIYLRNLEIEQLKKIKAELAKKMVNIPAPLFKLKDLKGNEVSLAALKGKTVVVDFWATWCGPCVASFPGMQKAVNKFKDDPNVVFLFIDTWEQGPSREKDVTEFINKNKYTFTVLYDETKKDSPEEFTVVGDFKVEGIPTKFVIDKNSNIRFKSVGYGGNADALATELSMMIELANTETKSGATAEKRGF